MHIRNNVQRISNFLSLFLLFPLPLYAVKQGNGRYQARKAVDHLNERVVTQRIITPADRVLAIRHITNNIDKQIARIERQEHRKSERFIKGCITAIPIVVVVGLLYLISNSAKSSSI